ncbi:MAG TPA: alkaline phosphatase D family protein [Steroidobacteraceae bacterium]|nr:alkaline phosphatase D family protein [Steroidobacteraceae bacterium]
MTGDDRSDRDHDPARRELLRQSLAVAGAAALGARAGIGSAAAEREGSDPHPALDRRLAGIAFGSCADSAKPQPVWEHVLARRNDLFVFLGDNIYGDSRDMGVLSAKYAELAAIPGFAKLRASTPLLAMWDDHDYGEDDAGGEYPMKDASRRLFLDFWGEPADSPRRTRDGVYAAYLFGPPGERVQVILPDLRYNRTALVKTPIASEAYESWAKARADAGLEVPGPYARNPDPAATLLGERQWAWLERQLEVPAEVRLFASSLQVLADFTGWESWANFVRDRDRLFDTIRRKRANGVVFLSGDIHYAELSKYALNLPYPMWELTSSGLTEEWRIPTPNANRASEVIADANFGHIDIDWKGAATSLRCGITDHRGAKRLDFTIPLAELVVRP